MAADLTCTEIAAATPPYPARMVIGKLTRLRDTAYCRSEALRLHACTSARLH